MIPVNILTTSLVLFASIQHALFCILETCMWRGAARGVFGTKKKDLNATSGLAANQGVYNLFLAMGATLSLYLNNLEGIIMFTTAMFLAACFGCTSVSMSIIIVQGIPSFAATMLAIEDGQRNDWRIYIILLGFLMIVWGYFWKKFDVAAKKKLKSEQE
jgi:uncharacterized membrane protein